MSSSVAEVREEEKGDKVADDEDRVEAGEAQGSAKEPGLSVGGNVGARRSEGDDEDDEDDDDEEDEDEAFDGVGNNGGGGSAGEPFVARICSPSSTYHGQVSAVFFGVQPDSNSTTNSSPQQSYRPILRPSAFKFSNSSSLLSGGPLGSGSGAGQSSSSFVLRPPKLIPSSSSKVAGANSASAAVQQSATASTNNSASSAAAPTFVPLEKEEGEGEVDCVGVVGSNKVNDGGGGGGESFVFGSNLKERVVSVPEGEGSPVGVKRKIEGEEAVGETKKIAVGDRVVVTGEENEVNVLQLQCRLFVFDSSKSWIERGRGLLRLNDSKPAGDNDTSTGSSNVASRLIIRTKGSLRVMLNTKVWDGMRVEKAGDKSVRIMAVDLEGQEGEDGGAGSGAGNDVSSTALRIFLIMTTSISDASTLTSALNTRVRRAGQSNIDTNS